MRCVREREVPPDWWLHGVMIHHADDGVAPAKANLLEQLCRVPTLKDRGEYQVSLGHVLQAGLTLVQRGCRGSHAAPDGLIIRLKVSGERSADLELVVEGLYTFFDATEANLIAVPGDCFLRPMVLAPPVAQAYHSGVAELTWIVTDKLDCVVWANCFGNGHVVRPPLEKMYSICYDCSDNNVQHLLIKSKSN